MEWAKRRGKKAARRAHLTNCAERASAPNTMLISAGFGTFPGAMCASNSGPLAMAARRAFSSAGVATI